MFVPISIKRLWFDSKCIATVQVCHDLLSFVFSLLSGASMACLKKISMESWPDLYVQSMFFGKAYIIHDSEASLLSTAWAPSTLFSCQCFLHSMVESVKIISDLLLNYGAMEKPTVTSEHPSWTTRQRAWYCYITSCVILYNKLEAHGLDVCFPSSSQLPFMQQGSTYRINVYTFNKTLEFADRIKRIDVCVYVSD